MRKKDKEKKERAMLRRIKNKSGIAFLVAIALAVIFCIRVISINVADGAEYSRIVLGHQARTSSRITCKRGDILDRNGTVLAYSKRVYNLILDPKQILEDESRYKEPVINAALQCFDITREELEDRIAEKPESHYEKMLTRIPEDQVEKFKALQEEDEEKNIVGITFEDSFIRTYPFNSLAADVIGFSTESAGGVIGLERQYDSELTGVDGLNYSYIDNDKEITNNTRESQDGANIVTTLDYGVQNILEKKIKAYNDEKPSRNTAAIVMDPNSGEILGMASYPGFDLNDPRDLTNRYTDEELAKMDDDEISEALSSLWSNFCVSNIYEPGSTFKAVTVASALEEGKVHDEDTFYCAGSKEVEGFNIRCWMGSEGGHKDLDLKEALGDSCNVSLMEIGFALGAQRMIENQYAFGFGSKTGIDLPGEERGIIKDPDYMTDTDVATNSFGQSLNVNMIQMCAAYGALINGGNYYQPHMVKAITGRDGHAIKTIEPAVVRQPVTKETSDLIREYLEAGVEEYAVQYSKVPGYSMGGKTATAEKLPRSEKKWLISVMSFAPVENPKFLLYVLIDEPDGTTGGSGDGMDSQYLTKGIMKELLPYMGITPTMPIDEDELSEEEHETEADSDSGVEVPETQIEEETEEYYDPEEEDSGIQIPGEEEWETTEADKENESEEGQQSEDTGGSYPDDPDEEGADEEDSDANDDGDDETESLQQETIYKSEEDEDENE